MGSGKKGKKGKGKGNGKKPHIITTDGVNPGGWLDGAQGSWGWDEDSRQSTTSRATTFKTRSSTTWPVTTWPRLMTATSRTSRRHGFPVVVLGSLLSGRLCLWRRKPTFLYCIKKKTLVHEEMNTIACFRPKKK